MQSKDVFPRLIARFKAIAAVFGERLGGTGSKVSQTCGDQVGNVTRRTLQTVGIRVILFHLRQSDDAIRVDSFKSFRVTH